jgi:flagellar hook protein FlgE
MGIFDALTTAVTGLQAQSVALQNISGNIANSSTAGFKRTDTNFADFVTGEVASKQVAGNVDAGSRSTNGVQGSIQTASVGTFMAINGDGFFVVQKPSSVIDGRPVFDGVNLYTRRGDFQPDKNGFLVNAAGYYLMGIPVDATTGNPAGSVPQVLQFSNDFLPAEATSQIQYRANLASNPLTTSTQSTVPGSELLKPADFAANPVAGPPAPASIVGTGANRLPDARATGTGSGVSGVATTTLLEGAGSLGLAVGDIITVSDGTDTDSYTVAAGDDIADLIAALSNPGNTAGLPQVTVSVVGGHLQVQSNNFTQTVTLSDNTSPAGTALTKLGYTAGSTTFAPVNLLTQSAVGANQTLTVTVGSNPVQTITFGTGVGQVATLADLQTALGNLTNLTTKTVNTSNGNITLTAANLTDQIVVGGTVTASNFGIQKTTVLPANGTVIASDLTTFLNESLAGGSITGYDVSGAAVNVQLRWAKVSSVANGGSDVWNLFYQTNSAATGTQVAWQNVGVNFTFAANGQMSPAITTQQLSPTGNVVINGVSLGNVLLNFGTGGITQFADPNGNVKVNQLQQDGSPAGNLQAVSINDKGRAQGTFSNGRTVDLAEITLANFTGQNLLKKLDGGAFSETAESGSPLFNGPGKIVGSSLESSNTDIADEFSKLIVTQQAYSANTKVITTGDQMVRAMLNMLQ